MSELPPPGPAPKFDFARPFRFVFDDPQWLPKIAIGGLFYLACFVIVGCFFVLGYIAQLARNVVAGVAHPLPEWKNLGAMFGEGVKLFVVALVYSLPNIIVIAVAVVVAIAAGAADPEGPLAPLVLGCFVMLMLPFIFAIYFFLPAAIIRAAVTGEMSAAFEFRALWQFVRRNFGNYMLAIVIHIIANAASQFGVALLCVGMIFTTFWSWVVSTYAFAEVRRLDRGA